MPKGLKIMRPRLSFYFNIFTFPNYLSKKLYTSTFKNRLYVNHSQPASDHPEQT